MPVTTNTRKLAALLGASGAGIGTDGLMQSAGIDTDMATQVELDAKTFDDDQIQTDIALLGFKSAANGSLVKYALVDQIIDNFQDASGIDASASTNEIRDATKYYSGGTSSTVVKEFAATNSSFTIAEETVFTKIIVNGGGGAGGSHPVTGNNGGGSGGGGGGFIVGIDYTSPAGVTSVNATIGARGAKATNNGDPGGTSSIVFGSDLTLTAKGGGGGVDTGAIGAGGTASKSGTASGATSTLALTGGPGGLWKNGVVGDAGSNGATSALDGTTYQSSGGGGGAGAGADKGGNGGNGLAASYTGGGGGGGGDDPSSPAEVTAGGSGYRTAGGGGYDDGTEDAQDATVDSATVTGATGGTGSGSDARSPRTNGGGGAFAGGGGGGGGDGGYSGTGNGGDGGQGYIRLEYNSGHINANLTLVSTGNTAESAPTKADLVMTYTNGAGTAVIGTNLTAEVSADNGSTWTSFGLSASSDQGDTGGHTILTAHDVAITTTIASPAVMRYRIKTLVQSAGMGTRIHAVSLGWG